MDDLYAHLSDLTPKLRENLATYEERARNNEKVMLLVRDVPLDFTLHDITLGVGTARRSTPSSIVSR